MFTSENTRGFEESELTEMNRWLQLMLISDDLAGLEEDERIKIFSERVMHNE